MKRLNALLKEAQENEKRRKLLLMFPSRVFRNCRIIDPWLKIMEFDDLPGQAVYAGDLPEDTEGLFTDTEEDAKTIENTGASRNG